VPGKVHGVSSPPASGTTGTPGQRAAAAPAPATAGSGSTDSVRITDTASHLITAEQALSDVPVISPARVAQIGALLASGGYKVSPERTADRLLRFERLLPLR
jgi:negative regulator of flagellin synthesis FlgM